MKKAKSTFAMAFLMIRFVDVCVRLLVSVSWYLRKRENENEKKTKNTLTFHRNESVTIERSDFAISFEKLAAF